jgi:hypothetical protein
VSEARGREKAGSRMAALQQLREQPVQDEAEGWETLRERALRERIRNWCTARVEIEDRKDRDKEMKGK